MKTNLRAVVNERQLPRHKVLLPVLEAVSNAAHAIKDKFEDSQVANGLITIEIKRDGQLDINNNEGGKIVGFVIIDNGEGFNDKNLESFETFRSNNKEAIGGQGFGRITYLRGFNNVRIESTFVKENECIQRVFNFTNSESGVENLEENVVPFNSTGTTLKLFGPNDVVTRFITSDINSICQQIFEDRLLQILANSQPKIVVRDGALDYDIISIYKHLVKPYKKESLVFENGEMTIQVNLDFYLGSFVTKHKVYICADGREVKSYDIKKEIVDYFPDHINEDELGKSYLIVVAQSDFFNEIKSNDRTLLQFPNENDLFYSGFTEPVLIQLLRDKIEVVCESFLKSSYEKNINRVEAFIDTNPHYTSLYKKNKEKLKKINYTISNAALEREFFEFKSTLEIENNKLQSNIKQLVKKRSKGSSEDALKEIEEYASRAHDLNVIRLGEYMLKREGIINFLKDSLNPSSDGRFNPEELFHATVFPLRKFGDEIQLRDENLWLIDERLAFNEFLASDKELSTYTESLSNSRPDIFIFNPTFAMGNTEESDCIFLVEFKKPGKYKFEKDYDPLDQLMRYSMQIKKDGGFLNYKNRRKQIKSNTRFLGFIVCEINDDYHNKLTMKYQAVPIAEKESYIYQNPNINLYVEINSYDKLIQNNEQKHRLFIDCLKSKKD